MKKLSEGTGVTRRQFVQSTAALGALAAVNRLTPDDNGWLRSPLAGDRAVAGADMASEHGVMDLRIARAAISINDRRATATTINGTVPGPLLRFREGEDVTIRVHNALEEATSIHWHGLIVPAGMDGVPGVSFPGIAAGTTFTYVLPIRQHGTYWYHSHSGLQEQLGHYGPIIIDPASPEPFEYDREYVLQFSDWSFEDPHRILDRLKKQSTYSNFQRRTLRDFVRDVRREGLGSTLADRWMWARMRMTPTDIADITAPVYTYLLNGRAPAANWTALFQPGERVRLRIINSGAGSYIDVRIPGLAMTVVAVSGQHVQPVTVDEIRVELAQTYDVIVEPSEDVAYTIFGETMDRSGYASGTLAPRVGMRGSIPKLRPRPILTMMDMGMVHGGMSGMSGTHPPAGTGATSDSAATSRGATQHDMAGHAMSGATMSGGMPTPARLGDGTLVHTMSLRAPDAAEGSVQHAKAGHGPGNAMLPMQTTSRLSEPGVGLGEDGWRVLVYTDLKAIEPFVNATQAPVKEYEFHLTGNMERYMWSLNGIKFSDVHESIPLTLGEQVRFTLVNDTMMSHPMHLHGMWMLLENGQGALLPRLHTVNVKPAERLSFLTTPMDAGGWAFHCHLLLHMEMGMFRVVQVTDRRASETPVSPVPGR